MKPISMVSALSVVALLALTACGGGGSSVASMAQPDMPEQPQQPAVERLPFPYTPSGHYSRGVLPRLAIEDARHMPVYRDGERLLVGVDQGSRHIDTFTISNVDSPDFSIHHIERDLASDIPVVGERGDIEIRHGRLNDGVGDQVVSAYLADAVGGVVRRYSNPPQVRIIGLTSTADIDRTIRAVQLVNAALPESAKVQVGAPLPGFSLRDNVGVNGRYNASGEERDNTIHVEFVPAGEYRRGANSAAVTWNVPDRNAYIQFNMGANSYSRDREAVILLAHELMHALGDYGHLPPRFASIMEGTGAIHHTEQNGLRQPLSLLYPVDREALQALYGRLENGDDPANFGPWASTTWRIDGNGPHANFGVALRNGYAEPWAYGYLPATDLADNPALSGSVTWTGVLLGISPDAAAVAGDAEIGVNLATLAGRTDFTNLETWAARTVPGEAGTGTRWLDGDLGYTIAVRGNTFRETGGDDGRVTGIFVGREHEGATGTLERSDLTAAFGAAR